MILLTFSYCKCICKGQNTNEATANQVKPQKGYAIGQEQINNNGFCYNGCNKNALTGGMLQKQCAAENAKDGSVE